MGGWRRNTNIELNFDGLTDSVTNLVGALILLVVLLIGVTANVVQQGPSAPPADSARSGQLAVIDLLEQLVVLQTEIEGGHAQVSRIEKQVAAARRQVAALRSTESPEEKDGQ